MFEFSMTVKNYNVPQGAQGLWPNMLTHTDKGTVRRPAPAPAVSCVSIWRRGAASRRVVRADTIVCLPARHPATAQKGDRMPKKGFCALPFKN
ncbi:hypothetical protein EVAR_28720_1 [Eumeta japonica]|uniref:Uncharacterized protein n=1 Tax=Eumeta variegata TaxID=151549 RepID=A0A4C1V5U4_EUMVA|nr:hypothetical protein EVAR_28720_1 [Eumeta japonica]